MHRQMAAELCKPLHSSDANCQRMGMWNIVARERCHTCFRSKILLVSCILSTLSFRTFASEPSASCWNTYSRCFFRNPSQRHQHPTTSALLHSSKLNSSKTETQNKGLRHFSNTGDRCKQRHFLLLLTAKILEKKKCLPLLTVYPFYWLLKSEGYINTDRKEICKNKDQFLRCEATADSKW